MTTSNSLDSVLDSKEMGNWILVYQAMPKLLLEHMTLNETSYY